MSKHDAMAGGRRPKPDKTYDGRRTEEILPQWMATLRQIDLFASAVAGDAEMQATASFANSEGREWSQG